MADAWTLRGPFGYAVGVRWLISKVVVDRADRDTFGQVDGERVCTQVIICALWFTQLELVAVNCACFLPHQCGYELGDDDEDCGG
jgi:hypothetical protein